MKSRKRKFEAENQNLDDLDYTQVEEGQIFNEASQQKTLTSTECFLLDDEEFFFSNEDLLALTDLDNEVLQLEDPTLEASVDKLLDNEQLSVNHAKSNECESQSKRIKSPSTLGLFDSGNSIKKAVMLGPSILLKLGSQETAALKLSEDELLKSDSKATLEYTLSQDPNITSWLSGSIIQTNSQPWFLTIAPGDSLEILNLMLKYKVKSEIVRVMLQHNFPLNIVINNSDRFDPTQLIEYILSRCPFEPILQFVDVFINAITNQEALSTMSQHCTRLITVHQNDLMKLNSIHDIQKFIYNRSRSLGDNQTRRNLL